MVKLAPARQDLDSELQGQQRKMDVPLMVENTSTCRENIQARVLHSEMRSGQ